MYSPMPSVGRGRLYYTPVTSTPMFDLETVQDVNDHLSHPPPQLSEGELKQASLKEGNESMESLPFVHPSVLHRLTRVPYNELLAEAADVRTDHVQDVFRWSTHPFDSTPDTEGVAVACHTAKAFLPGTVSMQEVEAVLHSCRHSDTNIKSHALLLPHLPQAIMPSESPDIDVMSHDYLMKRQQEDNVLSRVICFVERGRRPNRRERMNEPTTVLKFMKHWGKLVMKNGVLYRVSKNSVTKRKTYLYVVPDAVKPVVLKGVHDQAGHQGQQRTLYLARQRFFWHGLEKDVREYVKCCRRCVISKTPEPEGRAPLENIITTEPLELVCIDFWSAEDSANRSLDVLVTDQFTKVASAFLCPKKWSHTIDFRHSLVEIKDRCLVPLSYLI